MSTLFNFLTSRAILLLRQRRTPSQAACIVLSLLAGAISRHSMRKLPTSAGPERCTNQQAGYPLWGGG
jgi:hypothetical protein